MLLLIFVVIFYAGNIIVGRDIFSLPPFTISLFRLFIATIILFPLGLRLYYTFRISVLNYKIDFILMTLPGVTFFNTFIYGALQFTSTTNVSVLEASIPVFTVTASIFILKERLHIIQWAGIFISLIGAIWVVLDGRLFQLTSITWNIGDFIML